MQMAWQSTCLSLLFYCRKNTEISSHLFDPRLIRYFWIPTTRDVPHSLQLSRSLHPAPEYDPNIAQTCNVMKGRDSDITRAVCMLKAVTSRIPPYECFLHISGHIQFLILRALTLIKAFQTKRSFKL